jgi:hypothetical protein
MIIKEERRIFYMIILGYTKIVTMMQGFKTQLWTITECWCSFVSKQGHWKLLHFIVPLQTKSTNRIVTECSVTRMSQKHQ